MEDNNILAVIDAARKGVVATKVEVIGKNAVYAVPGKDGVALQTVSLETGLPSPVRKRGITQVFDAASFNAILEANDGEKATIYINRDANTPAIVAILNGNGHGGPGWGDHRAEILFRFTPQWLKWKSISGKMLGQLEFAEFIEENLSDIAEPASAAMLEIAQELSVKRSVDFKSAVRLQDGRFQFQNIENVEAAVSSGQIGIPTTITLGLAPVFGLPPFKIEARFRYRIENGKLKMGIILQRMEDLMEAVVNDMVNGTVGAEGRPAVVGIQAPQGAVMVEGLAPDVTK